MPQIGFTQKCDFRYQDTVRVKLKTWNERYMPCFALTQSTVSFLWRAIITQDCCTTDCVDTKCGFNTGRKIGFALVHFSRASKVKSNTVSTVTSHLKRVKDYAK